MSFITLKFNIISTPALITLPLQTDGIVYSINGEELFKLSDLVEL